jgi:multiple sugar transport system permease protein
MTSTVEPKTDLIREKRVQNAGLSKWLNHHFLVVFILTLGLVITLVPFAFIIATSFKTATEIVSATPTFFPKHPTLNNYNTIFNDPNLPLLRFYANSIFVTIANIIFNLFTSALIGFLFAKYEFRGKRILFGWFLLTMMIPFQLTMIPNYLILVKLHLVNNLWGLILPSMLNAFGIFMMRQFVSTIPDELLDSARIDGASEFQIFFMIILPELGPSLATLGTLTFMSTWNSYLWPLVVITDTEKRTLPIILTWYSSQHGNRPDMVMAALVLVLVPILFIYFFFQRWVVAGITLTGFK